MGLFSRHDDAKEQADIARANEARRKLEEARTHQAQVAAQQHQVPAPASGAPGPAAQGTPSAIPAAQPQQETYTVVKGDSLSRIAKHQLGDAERWHEIYEANREVIGGNPDLIKPGQQLRIPRGKPLA